MQWDLTVIGIGYVGLVSGVCFAELGFRVQCIDNDLQKVLGLNNNIVSLYEPGLEELLQKNKSEGKLLFRTWKELSNIESKLILVAVGTPQRADGNAEMQFVNEAIANIAQHVFSDKIIIIKSTVPVGTAKNIATNLMQLKPELHFDIISNPEFLREGKAIYDFMHPDRIIIGATNDGASNAVLSLYTPIINAGVSVVITDNNSAELVKYAANAYLATRIAFINEVVDAAGVLEANALDVVCGIGLDKRIGQNYLAPGPGFGGSCFPKDSQALLHMTDNRMSILQATVRSNEQRKEAIASLIIKSLPAHHTRIVTILGLTFKAETDDLRDSPSIDIAKILLAQDIMLQLYDPKGMLTAAQLFSTESTHNAVKLFDDAYAAMRGADMLVLLTEWPEFKELDFMQIKRQLKQPLILDMRGIINKNAAKESGFTYLGFEELGKFYSQMH